MFWLHRYDEIFLKDKTYGIIPASYKNYRISLNPYDNIYLPWSQRDNVRLLVLEKFATTEATQQLHRIKILVPEWRCDQNGVMKIPKYDFMDETA